MSTTFRRTKTGVPPAPPFTGPWGADLFANPVAVPLDWANPSNFNVWTEAFGSNAALGVEAGEPAPTGFTSSKSAWWKLTPTVTRAISIDTIGSTGDTEIALYTGASVGALTKITSDSDSGGSNTSLIKGVTVNAGTTYYLQVRAFNGAAMNYTVHFRVFNAAPNDLFANARTVVIPSPGATFSDGWFDNGACGTEASEPQPTGVSAGRSAWWKYTPASSGTAQFDTIGSRPIVNNVDTEIAVYTGASVPALVKLASDSDSGGGGTSKIAALAVVAGTTYYLQVDSTSGTGQMAYQVNVTGPAT